ncbi:MAG: effector-associated domain EAD1-containing protein [Scytonema sp. PMC 1069.18]|nr:effector-associated domain EAD1-containing protein [Scytonema sp. PMC 1069.18]MEC4882700.1 effector-associated domain EAD1-containing protein [Scytonema sp. PMC 1070.18]
MKLTGQQRKQLQDALVDAFSNLSSLERMLSYELDKNLHTIANGSNLKETVFILIKTAESQGWIENLVRAARKDNFGNLKLKTIAEQLLTHTADNPIRPNNQRVLRFSLFWLLTFFIGVGLFLTLHSAITLQWVQAFVCLSLSVILSLLTLLGIFLTEFLNRLFQNTQLSLNQLAERLADALWSQVEVWAWEFTSPFQRQYYQSLIDICRDYKTQGLKTKGEFTFALDKVFVPLKVLPKNPDRILPDMIQPSSMSDNLSSIWDILVANNKTSAYRSLAIIGSPGAGKSTLLKHLTLTYTKNTQRLQHREAPKLIPILLYLRDRNIQIAISKAQYPPKLSELIERQESIRKLKPPPQWFERKLCDRQCLVMLDGLDEVADFQVRHSISIWINNQIFTYRNATFLLTSRPYGLKSESDSLKDLKTIVEVQPFSLKQVETFIHNWYLQREIMSHLGKDDPGIRLSSQSQSNDLIERIKNSPPLAAMALNPLLLTMIATVHCYRGALPGRRVELYAEICDVLLGRRQEAKGISNVLTAEQKKAVLQVLALELMKQKTREFTPAQGYSLIQSELTKVASNNFTPKQFLKNIENICGLLVEREKDRYEFAHKSFQEYLAAIQIKETNQESLLITKINDDWWHETIRLYTAQTGATQIIRAALENPTVLSLKLALDCQEEGLRVDPIVRQQLEDTLEAGLESNDQKIFQLAAQVRLARRLSRLVRIDENQEIDNSGYITCAEYQLFLDEIATSHQPQHWRSRRFSSGDAKKTINGIDWKNANLFCLWLKLWSEQQSFSSHKSQFLTFYRLPTKEERNQYPITDDQPFSDSGIRLVKFQLPTLYSQLTFYLLSGEWRKADKETAKVISKQVHLSSPMMPNSALVLLEREMRVI